MSNPNKKTKTTWEKGKSGNPGGRSPRVGPNGETLAALCRAKSNSLVDRAYEIAMDKATDPKDALVAIFGLLDRGWGKPKDASEGDGKADIAKALSQLIASLPS
jgi:hypothetical protein